VAGRRRISTGDGEPPLELIDDDGPPIGPEGSGLDGHRWLRTGAAIVAAGALVWVGASVARQADADHYQRCINDVERAYWRYEQQAYGPSGTPRFNEVFSPEVVDELIAEARRCGATAYANALDRTRPTDDADDD